MQLFTDLGLLMRFPMGPINWFVFLQQEDSGGVFSFPKIKTLLVTIYIKVYCDGRLLIAVFEKHRF